MLSSPAALARRTSALTTSAQRIRNCVRDSDTVARLGGDEFTVILTEIRDMSHVGILARTIISELRRPFDIKSNNIAISCSIGIAIYPRDANDAAELLRHADQAMYQIKKAGRNRFGFCHPDRRFACGGRFEPRVSEVARHGVYCAMLFCTKAVT